MDFTNPFIVTCVDTLQALLDSGETMCAQATLKKFANAFKSRPVALGTGRAACKLRYMCQGPKGVEVTSEILLGLFVVVLLR